MVLRDQLLDWIGGTPLIAVGDKSSVKGDLKVFAKCEFLNPTGSSKARPAKQMILNALAEVSHSERYTLLDAGSGGTAEAEAMIASRLGRKFAVVVPASTPPAKVKAISAYGAQVITSEASAGSEGARQMAAKIAEEASDRYLFLNQYANDSNWRSHLHTAQEIFNQTDGQISHVYVGLGTGGTATGIGRGLKAKRPGIEIIGVMPASSNHRLYGLKHITPTNQPPILDRTVIDRIITITDDEALGVMGMLARNEGLLVGPSSGATYAAFLRERPTVEAGVVTIIMHDDRRKYGDLMEYPLD